MSVLEAMFEITRSFLHISKEWPFLFADLQLLSALYSVKHRRLHYSA